MRRERWSAPADPASAAVAVVAATAALAFSWALLHGGFWDDDQIVDTPVYERYGDAIARGEVPYRDFRPEYPPLALPAFALPSLAVGAEAPHDDYARVFDLLMLACAVVALVVVAVTLVGLGASLVRLAAALALIAVSPLLLGSVVLSRFDLWPAALVAGALAAAVHGRDRLAGGALGAAAAAKVYPLVLVPVLGAWVWRRRGRRAALAAGAVFAAVVAVCVVPFLLVAPGGFGVSLWRQLDRPLQLESLAAAALVTLRAAVGLDVEMVGSHGSQNVAGALGEVAGVLSTAAAAVVLVWLWARFARGPMTRERLVGYAAACVVAFVALGKVLSPQFLVWLVPLVPLVGGRRGVRASALLALALVLTQLWFPSRYWTYARELDGGLAVLVLVRDLVLVALVGVLVWSDGGRGTVASVDERDPDEAVEELRESDEEPSRDERAFLEPEHVPEVPGEPAGSPGEQQRP